MEMATAVFVLGLLLSCLAVAMDNVGRFNTYQLVRQQCIAAAQAELDSIEATGEPIFEEDRQRLWPGIEVAIERREGQGDWTGLELVKATARGTANGKKVEIELARYMPVEGK